MLTLFHGDTSVCSIKVRLALAEKRLAWTSKLLDLQRGDQSSPDYVRLNPAHVVPTLVDREHVIIESSIILEYLEDRFPLPSLAPSDPVLRSRLRLWLRRVDDLHPSCSTLSSSVKLAHSRSDMIEGRAEDYLQSIDDEAKRARQRRLVEMGFEAPDVKWALQTFDRFMADMEASLERSAFLIGEDCTLADLAALPYVNRADMLGLSALWMEARPALGAWLSRMRARPSYEEAIARWSSSGRRGRYKPLDDLTKMLPAVCPR